ncbi:MAG: arginyltransferase [Thermomonas sp.]|uniref:arginyltransferase n=1 Tax=Thermomonas sp. TaxID=1971895 RepID=UPI0039E6721F
MGTNGDDLRMFRTGAHPCGYWPDREARDLVLDPRDPRLPLFYPTALDWGFRRSGDIVYRPGCNGCRACVPVRIPIQDFVPNRSQRRCLAHNADVDARIVAPVRTQEHLALYRRYLSSRHAGGGMDDHGANEFDQFLVGSWNDGRFLELRQRGTHRLLAVAVTDLAGAALSAVYTFYDPDETQRSLGTLGVLKQIEWARRDGRAHLYLGYWIEGHPKMDYKRRFQPLERFNGNRWQRM